MFRNKLYGVMVIKCLTFIVIHGFSHWCHLNPERYVMQVLFSFPL